MSTDRQPAPSRASGYLLYRADTCALKIGRALDAMADALTRTRSAECGEQADQERHVHNRPGFTRLAFATQAGSDRLAATAYAVLNGDVKS